MHVFQSQIAEAISRARVSTGESQRAAARRAGIQQSALSSYETGRTPLPAWRLAELLDLYGCTWERFGVLLEEAHARGVGGEVSE